jgi:RNA:NAD 2'-phosphotransferase (TPT1/KptA family)
MLPAHLKACQKRNKSRWQIKKSKIRAIHVIRGWLVRSRLFGILNREWARMICFEGTSWL